MTSHLVPLPGTPWHVWRDVLVRSAGFPADGVDSFAAAGFAATTDAYLAGGAGEAQLEAAYQDAVRDLREAVYAAAANPRFRQAVTWQNPGALLAVEGVLRDGPDASRNSRRRQREDAVAKYWQRYCVKNDSIGFFGPTCWATLDGAGPAMAGRPGPALVRGQTVHLERWALVALAERIAEDPDVRPWLPVVLQPHLCVQGRELRFPSQPPRQLTAPVAALLARCDGRPAAVVARELAAMPHGGFRTEADVHAQVRELADLGVLRVGFDLPVRLSAEDVLREQLERIDDAPARKWAVGLLDQLCAARDATAAAGDPAQLTAAMTGLASTFMELTGRAAQQRPGETYAGRTLCHVDAVRDLDLAFGGAVLARLAPLDPLLRSGRWLTSAIAAAYREMFSELHRELAADLGSPEVPLGQLWYLALGTVVGTDPVAADVVADFNRRWERILGLDDIPAGVRELRFTTAELADQVAAAFPADAPGWTYARIHSPDVQLCATDWAAMARGEFTVVLGEMHIGVPAIDTDFFRTGHPRPEALRAALHHDLPESRFYLLLPDDFPRNTARTAAWMHAPADVQLGYAPAPGADRERLLPLSALTVAPGTASAPGQARQGDLVIRAGDGRSWPLVESFADLLSVHTVDAWKLTGGRGHTPRVVFDDLIVVRETWRTTVGGTGLAGPTRERDRYLAARRWRASLGLPERVFVRVATEIKPCFVDLTSLVYVRILCNLLRGAHAKAGDDVEVVVTEMLPTTGHAWLEDADGNRYTSELRLLVRDPQPAPR
ncbi:MAG TPA: lantibiotic dehydratase [Micromonosporaceae bacterium]|nr:lantibiotic dehydratase [Micromonosporaceae bacterium]